MVAAAEAKSKDAALLSGIDVDSRNFRLRNFFALELYKYPDFVQDLLRVAHVSCSLPGIFAVAGAALQEELRLEKDISKIESTWRSQAVELSRYKEEQNFFVLRANEEIRNALEDHLLQLQSMSGSRVASVAVLEKIRRWEKTLNTVREVLEAWLQVHATALPL
ncbi:UNVERIFIED_CONTAM: hypothetical protein H355_014891 [Colinus virginianus]|nr:hypothetical protein H355_014891 [Colinus virginianus]